MTTTPDLLDAFCAAIAGRTNAQDRVYRPGDWPTQPDQYPIQKLRVVGEEKISLGRSSSGQFTTTAYIRILSEVSAPAQLDNLGATDAEERLWALKHQLEVAIINSFPLQSMIQKITSVKSQLAFTSEGASHLAGVQTDFAVEFYQGPEDFAQPDLLDLAVITDTATLVLPQ